MKAGKLLLVATPIGNLSDMSPRALEALRSAGVVMAEDTRRTARFIDDRRKLYSYHDHNAAGRIDTILKTLSEGRNVAVVSDAGTPGISDPAYRAVRAALGKGFEVEAIPGPSAVICALVASGLPTDRFAFEGFLPRKKGARAARLKEMSTYPGSLVYYVGPHHLVKYLGEMRELLGNRPICVARELTKVHEEYLRGDIESVLEVLSGRRILGEITLVVGAESLGQDYFY